MNAQTGSYSPTYKNIKAKITASPKEIKDKMRKDYKSKVQNSRYMLLNKIRNSLTEADLHQTLTEIYNKTFNNNIFPDTDYIYDKEEIEILEELRKELVQEEVDWWLEEYEKSQMNNFDWSEYEDDNVICPICQKNNLTLKAELLTCLFCNISLYVTRTLPEIKNLIYDSVTKHSNICNSDGHFSAVADEMNTHIYFMCDLCSEMSLVV